MFIFIKYISLYHIQSITHTVINIDLIQLQQLLNEAEMKNELLIVLVCQINENNELPIEAELKQLIELWNGLVGCLRQQSKQQQILLLLLLLGYMLVATNPSIPFIFEL